MALIIGYGNPLRGDDGIGWAVVEQLDSSLIISQSSLELLAVHQLMPELADPVSEADLVIFVDACVDGEPGDVGVTAVASHPIAQSYTHHLGPVELLSYAQGVNGRCPSAYLITITGQSFGYEEKLSPPVEKAIPQVIKTIQNLTSA